MKFAILTHARSGGTCLANAISMASGMSVSFEPEFVDPKYRGMYKNEGIEKLLSSIEEDFSKICIHNIGREDTKYVNDNIKTIVLVRNDPISISLSLSLAEKTNVWQKTFKKACPSLCGDYNNKKYRIEESRYKDNLSRARDWLDQLCKLENENTIYHHHIYYGDENQKRDCCNQISNIIGQNMDQEVFLKHTDPSTWKLNESYDIIENLEELIG